MNDNDTFHKETFWANFNVKVPNATTREAISELELGKGKRLNSIHDLVEDLHADN